MNVQQPMESLQLRARQFFNRATLLDDITAGLVLGIESAPDGLAPGPLSGQLLPAPTARSTEF